MTDNTTGKFTPNQLALYYLATCPFCHRVFQQLNRMGLATDFEKQDANGLALKDCRDDNNMSDLIAGGGKRTVPCLKITHDTHVEWMYESADIIQFLQDNVVV